ncbi:hypothetical protein CHCC20335_3029 [Bacillus paralicheniformis]|nr:hypothetical protein CHCC20335_3029 [Bacillus paralicheniformis]
MKTFSKNDKSKNILNIRMGHSRGFFVYNKINRRKRGGIRGFVDLQG